MPVNESLLGTCIGLMSQPYWWYTRLVEHYADTFWLVGGGDLILHTIDKVRAECQLQPFSDSLSRKLAAVYTSPYDQYRLTVSLGTSALWHHGNAPELIRSLLALTNTDRDSDPNRPVEGEPDD